MTPLLAIALKGLVVMLAATLATRVLRTAPASTRHGIWVAAFAALLLLPVLEAAGPRWAVGVLPSAPTMATLPALPAPPPPPPAPPAPPALAVSIGEAGIDMRAFEASMQDFEGDMAAFEDDMAGFESSMESFHESTGGVAVAQRSGSRVLPASLGGVLVALWGLGAIVVLLRWLAATLAARRLVATSRVETDEEWGVLTEHARRVSGLERSVRLVRTDALDVPVAWGWGQPTVVLPADADEWSEDRREAVLLHEMAHLARRDAWTQAVAQVALAIHWMNPLAWWGYRRFLDAREHACDDAVIRSGARPSAYAAHLVGVARSVRRERLALSALAPMARTAPLQDRVVSILDASQARDRIGQRGLAGLMLLAAVVVVPVAALQPVAQTQPAPLATPNWTAIADTLDTLYGESPVAALTPLPTEPDEISVDRSDDLPDDANRQSRAEPTETASDVAPVATPRPPAQPVPPVPPAPPVPVDVTTLVEEAMEAAASEMVVDIDEVRSQIQRSIRDLEGDTRAQAAIERQALRNAQRGLADLDRKTLRIQARAGLRSRDSVRSADRRRTTAVDWTEIDRARRDALRHTPSTP